VDTKERSLFPQFSGHSEERKTLQKWPLILKVWGIEWPDRSIRGESDLLFAKQSEVFYVPILKNEIRMHKARE
jgi:hypothetical protein